MLKVRIKLKSFDHTLVDQSAKKIVKTVKVPELLLIGANSTSTHKEFIQFSGLHMLINKQENDFN